MVSFYPIKMTSKSKVISFRCMLSSILINFVPDYLIEAFLCLICLFKYMFRLLDFQFLSTQLSNKSPSTGLMHAKVPNPHNTVSWSKSKLKYIPFDYTIPLNFLDIFRSRHQSVNLKEFFQNFQASHNCHQLSYQH